MNDCPADRFFIRDGYTIREEPEYFVDSCRETEGIVHQPDVYPFAAHLARLFGVGHLIDIGCGRAEKLADFGGEFKLVGVDFGENVTWCRQNHGFGTWIDLDLESGADLPLSTEIVADSVVICSDVIEHLRDPTQLLRFLRNLRGKCAATIVTTPQRDLARGVNDPGPPANPSHVREWNTAEFGDLLVWAGLEPSFLGLTRNSNQATTRNTILAVIDRLHPSTFSTPPRDFSVTAIMTVFNEADVIESVVEHLISEGVHLHLIDNWSTDDTVGRINRLCEAGHVTVEKFPADGPTGTFDWGDLLRRVDEVAAMSDADWLIHHDADEIRRAPWPGVSLREAIFQVDQAGFNAVDHTVIEFWPVESAHLTRLERDLRYFQFGTRPGHFLQIKAWKRQPSTVSLAASGGHEAKYEGRRVFPYKFLLKHYPIRSQEHGEKKIFKERKTRWNTDERDRGWHFQYDTCRIGEALTKSATDLTLFDDITFDLRYLVERLTGTNLSSDTK